MHNEDPIVISSYARTAIGGFQGSLSSMTSTELGARAVQAAVERAGISGEGIDQIFMGCVLSAGLGQAPARQAALGAGLSASVTATTVNKMCGSGMQAAILACDSLAAGSSQIVIAGGMESMSNAPFLSKQHRRGMRIGHDRLLDHMFLDGLEDAYEPGRLMGSFADDIADEYQFSREAMDEYACCSLERANQAVKSGAFHREIIPILVRGKQAEFAVSEDEQPQKADIDKIRTLKPVFSPNGKITAANASSISDGAAAMIVTKESVAKRLGLPLVARIVAHAAHAQEPRRFAVAPVPAIQSVLNKAGWVAADVDLFEINEAFAAVAMIAERDLQIDRTKLNVNGGACALGHPIGASGARILVTLLSALMTRNGKRGIASLCIGGGEATAIAVEMY